MSITRLHYWLTLIVVLSGISVQAQNSRGGQAISLRENIALPSATDIPIPSSDRLLAEDEQVPGERFAAALDVNFTTDNSGEWYSLPDGRQMWRLHLRLASAKGVAAFYRHLNLAPGAELYFYRPDGTETWGAYTAESLAGLQQFWTGFVHGEEVLIEYVVPANTPAHQAFQIWRIDHAFRPIEGARQTPDFEFGAAKPCHPNANCDLGNDWNNEKNALSRIIVVVAEGAGYCSGNILNNTAEDRTPYLMTGFHCQDGFTPLYDMWRFDFGYRSQDCANPADEPDFTSILGSTFRAGRQENDFLLLELSDIMGLANVHFSGWNKNPEVPDTAVILHHPRGDIMKIGRSTAPISIITNSINWNNNVTTPANHHLRVNYTEGSFEVGSSGASIYDQDHRVVGHLHGGNNNPDDCDDTQGFFGRLHMAWEGGGTPETRLKDWLDPLDLDIDTLDALSTGLSTGTITTRTGTPIAGVDLTISVNGDMMVQATTTTDGTFSWPMLSVGDEVELSLSKNTNHINGVSVFDLVLTSKHILTVQPFDDPYQLIAADVNDNGSVSTADVIQMKKLSLNIDEAFSNVPSWRFVPANMNLDLSSALGADIADSYTFTVTDQLTTYNIIGVKMGDVNDSADVN